MTAVISEHIQITPGTCGGKPRIAGHRIRVQDIVVLYEEHGLTPDEIVDDYSTISLADVHAALAYYYDNMETIRRHIRESDEFVQEMRAKTPSIIDSKRKTHRA